MALCRDCQDRTPPRTTMTIGALSPIKLRFYSRTSYMPSQSSSRPWTPTSPPEERVYTGLGTGPDILLARWPYHASSYPPVDMESWPALRYHQDGCSRPASEIRQITMMLCNKRLWLSPARYASSSAYWPLSVTYGLISASSSFRSQDHLSQLRLIHHVES